MCIYYTIQSTQNRSNKVVHFTKRKMIKRKEFNVTISSYIYTRLLYNIITAATAASKQVKL